MDRKTQTSYKQRDIVSAGRVNAAPVRAATVEPRPVARRKRRTLKFGRNTVIGLLAGVVLLVGGGATYAQLGPSLTQNSTTKVNLQKGLVGWWKLDGNANDSSALRNTGTLVNTPSQTTDRKGVTSKAYAFNRASSQYVNVSDNSSLQFGTDDFTISSWIKTTYSATESTFIGKYASPGSQLLFRLNTAGPGRVTFVTGNDGVNTALNSSASYADGGWHHMLVTRNGTTGTLYIDGVQVDSKGNFNGTVSAIGAPFGIGKMGGGINIYYDGSIDDVRMYKRSVNANEVKALYDGYNPSTNIGSGEKGLVGWWKMDGNSNDSTPLRRTNSRSSTTSVADRKGTVNSAYTTNGTSNSGIDINTNSATDPLTSFSTFTMSAWVRFDSAPSAGCRTVVYKRAAFSANNPGFAMYWCFANNNFAVDFGNTSSNRWDTGYIPTVGAWTHYAYTYSGGTGRLYINGTLYGTSTAGSLANAQVQSGMTLGKAGNQGNYGMGGALDDVRIYNRELSANDINAQYKSYNSQISLNSNSNNVNTSTGLIGYWPFNGNANDSTPYRRNLTTASSPSLSTDRNARANSSYAFSPPDNFYTVGSTDKYNLKNLTFSAWIRPTSVSGLQVITSVVGAGGWQFRLNSNKLEFLAGGVAIICTSTGNVSTNTWTFATVTYDASGNCNLYLNGASSGSATNLRAVFPNNLAIGASSAGGGDPFNGSIDDVRIYNRVLSPADIAKLYGDYR